MIGNFDNKMIEAILETIPIDFSVVDRDDNVIGWNKHETRIFKRPKGVVGKNVRKCHPQRSIEKVEKILSEMKAGKRDRARFWIDKRIESSERPQKILIEYYALRDQDGNYLGCLEASQNITEIQSLKGEKRLLD